MNHLQHPLSNANCTFSSSINNSSCCVTSLTFSAIQFWMIKITNIIIIIICQSMKWTWSTLFPIFFPAWRRASEAEEPPAKQLKMQMAPAPTPGTSSSTSALSKSPPTFSPTWISSATAGLVPFTGYAYTAISSLKKINFINFLVSLMLN